MSMASVEVQDRFQPLLRNHQVAGENDFGTLYAPFDQVDNLDPVGNLRREAQRLQRSRAVGFGEELPPSIQSTAERQGIRPEIIVGRELTEIGEVGWLVAIHEQTDEHDYEVYAKMRIEEAFRDGDGFNWPARIWILPLQIVDNGQEVVIPPNVKALGYEILVNRDPNSTGPTNIGMDSVCLTGMLHGGHTASGGDTQLGCDCHGQLEQRRQYIASNGGIEIIGLGEEGRGNGMDAHTGQIHAQSLAKQQGQRVPGTYETVQAMGYPKDGRPPFSSMYPLMVKGIFGIKDNIVIPTNNPAKAEPFQEFGISTLTVEVVDPRNPEYYDGPNAEDKRVNGGHTMPTTGDHANSILQLRPRAPILADRDPHKVIELDPEHNRNARDKAIEAIRNAQETGKIKMAVFLDRDETLTLTALKHTEALRSALIAYGYLAEELPTFEDVLRAGGTDGAFGHIKEYEALISIHRASARFNTSVPLVDERIPDILRQAQENGFLSALCLTAAPVELAETVEAEINKTISLDIPTIGKPEHIDLRHTSAWKIREMKKVAEATGQPIVIIDDSRGLGHAIAELNDPLLYCITLAGTLTNEHTLMERDRRELILSDVQHLPEVLESIYRLAQQRSQTIRD